MIFWRYEIGSHMISRFFLWDKAFPIRVYCGSKRTEKQTCGYRRRKENRVGKLAATSGPIHRRCESRLIKVIRRLTNSEEGRGALCTGRRMCMSYTRARAGYINERDTKKGSKKYTLSSKLNLSMRGLSMRADRRCAPSAHSGCFMFFFFCRLLFATQHDDDSHACQFLYILVSPLYHSGSQSGKFKRRSRANTKKWITGTGASKAAFPGYDARCDRRVNNGKWICLSFRVWKFCACCRWL